MKYMLIMEAQELLYNFIQKLFKGHIERLKSIAPDQAFEKDADTAIIDLSKDLNKRIEDYPDGVQRYIYEILSHALAFLMLLEDDRALPELIDDSMSADARLSLLLSNGIHQMKGLIPKSH